MQVSGGGPMVAVAQTAGSWEKELDMEQGSRCRAGKERDKLEASSKGCIKKRHEIVF